MTAEIFADYLTQNPEVRPYLDYATSKAIETYTRNHRVAVDLGPRLEAIEKALEAKDRKIREIELQSYAAQKASEAGIPVSLLDGFRLEDEAKIAEKVAQLAESVEKRKTADINREMVENAHRPGSGIEIQKPDYLAEAARRLG